LVYGGQLVSRYVNGSFNSPLIAVQSGGLLKGSALLLGTYSNGVVDVSEPSTPKPEIHLSDGTPVSATYGNYISFFEGDVLAENDPKFPTGVNPQIMKNGLKFDIPFDGFEAM